MMGEVLKDLPKIETRRLILRKFIEEDLHDMFEYMSDPEVAEFALWEPHKSVNETRLLLKNRCESYINNTGSLWAIYHKNDLKTIGSAGFIKLEELFLKGEVGYTLSQKYWNKGYATEVVEALINFGFKDMGLHRIEAICHINNLRSTRVLEKVNMAREGLLNGYYRKNAEHLDVYIYAIVKGNNLINNVY